MTIVKDELGGPTYFVTHDSERINTSYLFFVMLENGISLVAVNLPSLWLLCTSVIPDKMVRSLRSVISLVSINSRGSGSRTTGDGETIDPETLQKAGSTASSDTNDRLVLSHQSDALRRDLEGHNFQSYAMHEFEQGGTTSVPKNAIHVQHTIELSRS